MSADIAVVGMACRFPDAPTLAQYWRNILTRKTSFKPIDDSRWTHSRMLSESAREPDRTYTKNGAFIDDIDSFAAMSFNIPPRRAEAMDPQQRLFLECVSEALEDSGIKAYDKTKSGVIVGVSVSEHKDLATGRARVEQMLNGEFGTATLDGPERSAFSSAIQPMRAFTVAGNLLNMSAAVVAQALDITGPAFAIDAACASGLAAIVQAVNTLRHSQTAPGEVAPVMFAGGVYLNLLPDNLVGFARVGAVAREECRPFDADASGFIMGEGVGAVVLKRLEDAERDGDRIYAVIRGAAVNSDGRGEGPMTPRREGQVALLKTGLADARVGVDSIEYIEAHGTATAVGDRTELEAWAEVGVTHARIGSMKANIGHTMSAAGVAGFIRTALSLYHRTLPPQASFTRWNPQLEGFATKFAIETQPAKYADAHPLATVSAFGFGGTNAFCVLQGRDQAQETRGPHLFLLSASSAELVKQQAQRIAEAQITDLAGLSYTLLQRPLQAFGACVVADSVESLKKQLANVTVIARPSEKAPVIAMFPGQGAQAPDAFKDLGDSLLSRVRALAQPGHYELLFPDGDKEAAKVRLQETDVCQPALAALELAVFDWLTERGITFDAALGHSLGEFIAAAAAGRLDARDAVRFVAARGREMAKADRSAMLAVKAGAEKAKELAARLGLEIANFNHPEQTVLGGSVDAVDAAVTTLKNERFACSKLAVSHAFHTSYMRSVARPIADLVDALPLKDSGTLTLFSCVDGVQAPDTGSRLKRVWREHAVRSVCFEGTVRAAAEAYPNAIWLQLGPGQALSQSAHMTLRGPTVLTLGLPGKEKEQTLLALGVLALHGHTPRWELVVEPRRALAVPPTPLARDKYWVIDRNTEPKRSVRLGEGDSTVGYSDLEKLVSKQLEVMKQQTALIERLVGSGTVAAAAPIAAPVQDDVENAVFEAVAKVSAFPREQLKREQNLVQDLGFDSLMLVELAANLRDSVGEVPRDVWAEGPSIARVIQALGAPPIVAPVETAAIKRFVRVWKPAPATSTATARVLEAPSLLELIAAAGKEPLVVVEHTPTALEAAVRSLQQEYPEATLRYVLATRDTPLARIAAEAGNSDPVVRLTHDTREVPDFETRKVVPVPTFGTVLVTGGTSGVGKAIAEGLRARGAQVVTLGRRADADIRCDVTDAEALKRALHGRTFDGVVHATGIARDMRAVKLDAQTIAEVRAPKMAIKTIVEALPGLKWVLATSSWASAFGNHGQLAYAAANAEMDLYVQTLPLQGASVLYPPWKDTGLAKGMSWSGTGIRPLEPEAAVEATLALIGTQGVSLLGYALPDTFAVEALPYIEDHKVKGTPRLPLATALSMFSKNAAIALKDVHVRRPINAPGNVRLVKASDVLALEREGAPGHAIEARRTAMPAPIDEPPSCFWFDDVPLTLEAFYARHAFHGPKLQAITKVLHAADTALEGEVKRGSDNVLALDGSFQLALFWAQLTQSKVALPTAIEEVVWLKPWTSETVRCRLDLSEITETEIVGTIRYYEGAKLIGWMRNVRAKLLAPESIGVEAFKADAGIAEEHYKIEAMPAYQDLKQRLEMADLAGLKNPYFTLHERVTNNTSLIGGREVLNYSSYNYVGLSGHPEVSQAANDAILRYGTSVSASRVASGEKPLHRELEAAIARFVGTEDAIVMVGGHSTNVGTISHLMGPGDLILHDALIHDSALGGAKMSGAQRRPFPHNDAAALEKLLAMLRPKYKKVLVIIEGAYSMDGDLADLPAFIALRNKYKCWLMVDEAHSLGVLGEGGRGIGEHFNVDRSHVDMWMGTLSKSLSSCGGYIAGSRALVEYLKYTSPSFVYSVGISPANAAAALKSIEVLEREPERVKTLHARSRYFLQKAKALGLNTGLSEHSAVVPVIVGNSYHCLLLGDALFKRGINVNPIIYPAVEDDAARLRFFITSEHTEEQIDLTVNAVAECLSAVLAQTQTDQQNVES